MNAVTRRAISIVATLLAITAILYSCKLAGLSKLQVEYERHRRVVADIRGLGCELDRYKEHNGSYPIALNAVKDMPKDPWNQNYIYRFPGIRNRDDYDLFSAGADQKPDTADDDWGQ